MVGNPWWETHGAPMVPWGVLFCRTESARDHKDLWSVGELQLGGDPGPGLDMAQKEDLRDPKGSKMIQNVYHLGGLDIFGTGFVLFFRKQLGKS